jgi:sulfite reductase (NADPH) flavoprotein alpha-component
MTTPTLPETAPFNPTQRSWLNGFFAGLVNTNGQGGVASATLSPPTQDSGVSTQHSTDDEDFPWHDSALPLQDHMALAKDKPLDRQMMAAMAQLDCGACGYLCQTYSEAIAKGEENNLTLCSPGGKETTAKLKELIQLRIPPKPGQSAGSPATKAPPRIDPATTTYSRKNPFPARLLSATALNKPGSDKDTRHVVLDLKSSGLSYKPGDALGLWPENCLDLVNEILQRLHASGAEDVPGPDGQPISLFDALSREYAITAPTDELFQLLGQGPVENVGVIDALKMHDGANPIDPAKFVAALSPMQPRLYSISSSLKAHPDQVHLTVGVVRYTNGRGTAVKGCASTYLAERVRPGQKARIFFHASKFALPADDHTPVIMVGPGTGIAPFRSFLHERKAANAPGKNWLFFGDQKSSTDFLYENELAEMQACGTLTQLSTAFSRDQKHKVYVQTRMLEHAREIWAWLQQGAHFYVCGDAKRMAADVDNALKQIVMEQGGKTADEAAAYIAELARQSRYQRDVY